MVGKTFDKKNMKFNNNSITESFHEMDLKTGSITNQIDTNLKVEKANICFLNKLPCIVGFSINKTIFLFNIAAKLMFCTNK